MVEMTVKEMLGAGVHFGHQTHRWDPRMKPYIYGARNGIHIIDLQKTMGLFRQACDFIANAVAQGGSVLFVGTKRQAQPIIEEETKRCGMFYVTERWLGGTLTNFKTIKASIDHLKDLEKKMAEDGFGGFTKKERLMVEREIIKLTKSFGGIKDMTRLPTVMFVVDPHNEQIALQEANRLHIPVVAVADTNCNPDGIDYLIPGNDDAIKSIRLFASKISQACLNGLARRDAVLRERSKESDAPLPREAAGGKGKAYVSQADTYEEETGGAFKAADADLAAKVPL